ncbi:MAG: hypothetical protein R6X33_00175 [Candidatus Brocadiia bacterium]
MAQERDRGPQERRSDDEWEQDRQRRLRKVERRLRRYGRIPEDDDHEGEEPPAPKPKKAGRAKDSVLAELEYQMERVREIGEQMGGNPLAAGQDADIVERAMRAGLQPLCIIIAARAQKAADEGWTWPEWRESLVDELTFLTELVDALDEAKEEILASGLWPWPV